MSVEPINASNYNVATRNDNSYNKTKRGKIIGTVAGALTSTATLAYTINEYLVPGNETFLSSAKEMLRTKPLRIIGFLGAGALIGFAIGAAIDGIVNKVRVNNADKVLNTQA